jgi:ParB family chromosome partitioning protein
LADKVRLVDPQALEQNSENPRLIFRQEELDALQESIARQGILVPLTVFERRRHLILLDGERRWRCAMKLGLPTIPVIVQPEPDRLQNIMMMFAIHNARKDWDPLPTAFKLRDLETEFLRRNGRSPSESELAGLASLSRGEVRRLKKLLSLPRQYLDELMSELERPTAQRTITVDHVIETTRGTESLRNRGVISTEEEEPLRRAIIQKFRSGVIRNTVEPRKLARLARAVERNEIPREHARRIIEHLRDVPTYSIEQAFSDSVEQADYEHSIEQLASRLLVRVNEHIERRYHPSPGVLHTLSELLHKIRELVGD